MLKLGFLLVLFRAKLAMLGIASIAEESDPDLMNSLRCMEEYFYTAIAFVNCSSEPFPTMKFAQAVMRFNAS